MLRKTTLPALRTFAGNLAFAGGLVFAGGLAFAGCGPSADVPGPSSATSALEQARALLVVDARLPARAEVVALCDELAVSASKPEQASALRVLATEVAADLRIRLFRLDAREADAREALELLENVTRLEPLSETACRAKRKRAHLSGELLRSASASYRELYLAKRSLDASNSATPSACMDGIRADLAELDGYRPSGEELAALEREGDRALSTAKASQPSASASASGAAVAPTVALGEDIVVSPQDLAPAKGPVKITKIERYVSEGAGRVVLHLAEPTTFRVGALAKDDNANKQPRVFVDIDKGSVKDVAREIEVGGAITRIRTGARADGARVVLDLNADLQRKVFYLPHPFRIVIDVSPRRPVATAGTGQGPRVVKRVAIDPGHGGHDDGAVGPTGLKEKEVALNIAHRIAPVLAAELGIETMLTRDTDVFVPLEERTARANAFHADLFISIHCNASENGEARGLEVFVLEESRDISRAARRVAALENGVSLGKTLDPENLDAEMMRIAARLSSGDIAASSRKLADLLATASLGSLADRYPDTKDHGVKSAGFYVLMGAEMPAVLFETSFISNPDDEARLAKADFRQKLADGVVNGVRAFREGK